MDAFSIRIESHDPVTIIRIQGYLALEAGQELHERLFDLLKQGKLRFLLDFSECKLISSPGVVSLLELVIKVTDDFRARIAISGLDDLKTKVFKMAGVSNIAPAFPQESQALGHLLKDS